MTAPLPAGMDLVCYGSQSLGKIWGKLVEIHRGLGEGERVQQAARPSGHGIRDLMGSRSLCTTENLLKIDPEKLESEGLEGRCRHRQEVWKGGARHGMMGSAASIGLGMGGEGRPPTSVLRTSLPLYLPTMTPGQTNQISCPSSDLSA